jgi:hypothetical protein
MQNAAAQQAAFGGYAAQATQTQVVRTLAAFNLQGDYTPTFEELNDEGSIYNMPIQTAIDLAINKFGSGWFKDEATQDALDENTKFWLEIMSKLFKAGHLVCERCHQVDKDEIIVAWKIKDTDHGNR